MLLFVISLQTLTDIAFFEAYSESQIKEIQTIYETYNDQKKYYEEVLLLFSSADYIQDEIKDTLNKIKKLSNEDASAKIEEFAGKYINYISEMDIYLIDSNNIVRMFLEGDTEKVILRENSQGNELNFERKEDFFSFFVENEVCEEESTYNSSHLIVEKIEDYSDTIYIVGIPRYDQIFDFVKSAIVIYGKYDTELLRLNTESIQQRVPSNNISKGKNYKRFGVGESQFLLCYYSSEDEQGEYCLSLSRDYSFSYRYVVYVCLFGFFLVISIVYWLWSEKITKPLDFFLMWIKLIRDKDSLKDDNMSDVPKPKANYFLQNNIMLFFSFSLIPIIFAGGIQWYAENQILNGYIEERYVESAEFYGNILNEEFYVFRNPITLLSSDERLIEALDNRKSEEIDIVNSDLDQYIHEYSKILSNYGDILTIYDADGNVVASDLDRQDSDRYIKYRINVDEDYRWSFPEGLDIFILHHKIYDENRNIIGYCKLELNNPDLHTGMSYNRDYLYSCYIYKYTDKIYNLISAPSLSDEKVVTMIKNTEDYPLTKIIMLDKANINYFYIVKEMTFFDRIWDQYVISFMNIVFLMSFALIFAAGVITRLTLNPIIHLSNVLYNDSPQVPMSTLLLGKEEFALIVNRVKALSDQISTYAKEQELLEAERREHEKKRKDAEILTLQTQINPHFMYNIFSSIGVLIRTGQTEKATKMVMYTGNLMRMGLYRGHVMIPLKEELDHVSQYINIQQIRYNNCMDVNIDIDDALMQLKVVKFILQPIIENAIEHNVGYFDDRKLKIVISAIIQESRLIIQVNDNGIGMTDEERAKLQQSINNFDMSNHLGLANINERIKLNCGDEYGVILDNNLGNGLRIELILPVITTKED